MNAIPHKHAEKIKQWADAPEWWDVYSRPYGAGSWTVPYALTWNESMEYELRKSTNHPDNIKPKKRLIDWSRLPRGTMTNRGEFMRAFTETRAITWVLNGIETPLIFDLRLAEQTQFTYWSGGECPVPEGVVGEIVFRDGDTLKECEFTDDSIWRHRDPSNGDIIAYRITCLAYGWTDNPEESI